MALSMEEKKRRAVPLIEDDQRGAEKLVELLDYYELEGVCEVAVIRSSHDLGAEGLMHTTRIIVRGHDDDESHPVMRMTGIARTWWERP